MPNDAVRGVSFMALIKCPECGHDVSTFAQSCPNCGYPISDEESADLASQTYSLIVPEPVSKKIPAIRILQKNSVTGLRQLSGWLKRKAPLSDRDFPGKRQKIWSPSLTGCILLSWLPVRSKGETSRPAPDVGLSPFKSCARAALTLARQPLEPPCSVLLVALPVLSAAMI